MTTAVRIDPSNPFDFEPAELEHIAAEVRKATEGLSPTDVDVARRPEVGYGGPLIEVLNLWIALGAVQYTGSVVRAAAGVMHERWKKDRTKHPDRPRPRVVSAWDLDGNPLGSVIIEEPDGTPKPTSQDGPAPHPYPEDNLPEKVSQPGPPAAPEVEDKSADEPDGTA